MIERDKLIKAIKILDMVPQQAGVPSSDYVKVEVFGTSIRFTIAADIIGFSSVGLDIGPKKDETFCLDRRLLFPFILEGVNSSKDFDVQLGEKVHVTQGKRIADFDKKTEGMDGYGAWRKKNAKDEDAKLSDELKTLLTAAGHCGSSDPSQPHLDCVYLTGDQVLVSDTRVVFRSKLEKGNWKDFPFPLAIVPLLGSDLVQMVSLDEKMVRLECGQGRLEAPVSAKARTDFPKKAFTEAIEKARKWPVIFTIPAEKLSKVVDRMSTYVASVKREDWTLQVMIDAKGRAKIVVQLAYGRFEEAIVVERPNTESEPMSLEWPLESVLPMLQFMSKHGDTIKVRWQGGKSNYLIQGAGVDLIVARIVKK